MPARRKLESQTKLKALARGYLVSIRDQADTIPCRDRGRTLRREGRRDAERTEDKDQDWQKRGGPIHEPESMRCGAFSPSPSRSRAGRSRIGYSVIGKATVISGFLQSIPLARANI